VSGGVLCGINGCSRAFGDKRALHQHRCAKHWRKRPAVKPDNARPLGGWSADDVYSFVEDMDLPDGAHWAMIEELSGLEPGDFA
jgi:hypothetical protein